MATTEAKNRLKWSEIEEAGSDKENFKENIVISPTSPSAAANPSKANHSSNGAARPASPKETAPKKPLSESSVTNTPPVNNTLSSAALVLAAKQAQKKSESENSGPSNFFPPVSTPVPTPVCSEQNADSADAEINPGEISKFLHEIRLLSSLNSQQQQQRRLLSLQQEAVQTIGPCPNGPRSPTLKNIRPSFNPNFYYRSESWKRAQQELNRKKRSAASSAAKPSVASDPNEIETDDHRLIQRQKQIDFGKKTPGYARYLSLVPRCKRDASLGHPVTPDLKMKISKRNWDKVVRNWRRALHKYDDPDDREATSITVAPSSSEKDAAVAAAAAAAAAQKAFDQTEEAIPASSISNS